MTALQELFEDLVDEPVAPPASLNELRQRARRHRVRRLIGHVTVVVIAASGLVGAMRILSDDGRAAVQVAGPGATLAEYRSTADAGFSGLGRWVVTVTRGDMVIRAQWDEEQSCAPAPFIRKGDVVRAEILDDASVIEIGPKVGCPGR